MQDQVKCRRFAPPIHLLAALLLSVPLIATSAGAPRAAGKEIIPANTAAKAELVEVLRGDPQNFGAVASETDEAALSRYEILDTRRGWFLDRQNNRIGNCYRASTGRYKERVIRCIWKNLP